jgi:hypothetical protein
MYISSYLNSITAIMDQIVTYETNAIGSAAQLCAEVIAQGGVIHVFGTAHSSHEPWLGESLRVRLVRCELDAVHGALLMIRKAIQDQPLTETGRK